MKKVLLFMLSIFCVLSSFNLNSFAISEKKQSSSSKSDISEYKEKYIIRGPNIPSLVFNSQNNAQSISNSKAVSKASAGGSKLGSLLKFLFKVLAACVVYNFAQSSLDEFKKFTVNNVNSLKDFMQQKISIKNDGKLSKSEQGENIEGQEGMINKGISSFIELKDTFVSGWKTVWDGSYLRLR